MTEQELTPYCFKSHELYRYFDWKSVPNRCKKYGYSTQEELISRMFRDVFHMILLDIVENNDIFVLPTKKYAEISMGVIEGEQFKRLYRHGAFQGLDYLATDFTAYRVQFLWKGAKGYYRKTFYFNKDWRNKIIEQSNKGTYND